MQYPQEFPTEARNRVEAEKIRARRRLEQALAEEAAREHTTRRHDEEAFHVYVLDVFLVFAREACDLGKARKWSVDQIRWAAEEFVRQFTIEAYYDSGRDRYGSTFPKMHIDVNGALSSEVERIFRSSEQWRQFETELLRVVESQSEPGSDRAPEEGTTDLRTLVDDFLQNFRMATDGKITRKQIWQAAGHKTGRQFEFWQSGSPKATREDDRNFRRLLNLQPQEFADLLQRLKNLLICRSRSFSLSFSSLFLAFPRLLLACSSLCEEGHPEVGSEMNQGRSGTSADKSNAMKGDSPMNSSDDTKNLYPPGPEPFEPRAATGGESRKRGRPFEPGNTFSKGRPKGSRNKKTLRALKLFEEHSAALMALAISRSREDPQMLRTFLGRLLPRARDLPVNLGRLPLRTFEDLNRASEKTLNQALAGKINARDAGDISKMIEDRRRVLETQDLERRITMLENRGGLDSDEGSRAAHGEPGDAVFDVSG